MAYDNLGWIRSFAFLVLGLFILLSLNACEKADADEPQVFEYCVNSPLPVIPIELQSKGASLKVSALINCDDLSMAGPEVRRRILQNIPIDTGRGILGLVKLPEKLHTNIPFVQLSEAAFVSTDTLTKSKKPFDLILNRDCLFGTEVILNPTKKVLTLSPLVKPSDQPSTTDNSSQFTVPMIIGRVRIDCRVDLTMSYSFKLSTRTAAILSKSEPDLIKRVSDISWFGAGELYSINSSSINGTTMPRLLGNVSGATDSIGMSTLNRFITAIDYTEGTVSLSPRSLNTYFDHSFCDGFWFKVQLNKSFKRELLTVHEILPGSIAADSGFLPGDQIIAISDLKLEVLTPDTMYEALHRLSNIRDAPLECSVIRENDIIGVMLAGDE